jgi:hypothetical protein
MFIGFVFDMSSARRIKNTFFSFWKKRRIIKENQRKRTIFFSPRCTARSRVLPKRTLRGTSDARRKSGVEDKKDTKDTKDTKDPQDSQDNKARETRGPRDTTKDMTDKLGPPIGLAVQAAREAREAREPQDQARRAGST